MPMTEAQKRAVAKYQNGVIAKRLQIKLYKDKDADIMARLDEVKSKQGYIKSLIRADIAKNGVKTHKL